MFVRKTRHFLEFAFILLIVCFLSYMLTKAFDSIRFSHSDLDFNPNVDIGLESLLDDN